MPSRISSEEIMSKTYGRLTPIKELPPRNWINKKGNVENQRYWLCRCECGVEKEIKQAHFRNGWITSCGCFGRDEASARERKLTCLPEGYTRNCDQSSEYFITWKSMIDRCYNPENSSYYNYGGLR